MPVRDIENEMQKLAALCDGVGDECRQALRKALRDKVNLIVAKAARIIGQQQLRALIPDLVTAFDRALIDPAKSDPKCWAKEAIAKALKDLDHAESALFLKGAAHMQMEPVWGGEEDTATALRGICTLALLNCTDLTREDKLWAAMRLLTEASPSLRKDGAVALESLEGREAALLLRLKARMHESDYTVTGQVLESLLRIEGDRAIPFITEFLRHPIQEVREESALALGASRSAAAIEVLKNCAVQKHAPVTLEILYRALAISRQEQALEFLYEVIRTRRPREVTDALYALELHRDSAEIRSQIARSIEQRSEPEIRREFERLFPAG
jgi:HEAT repeat protein